MGFNDDIKMLISLSVPNPLVLTKNTHPSDRIE